MGSPSPSPARPFTTWKGDGDAWVLIHGFPSCAQLTFGRLLEATRYTQLPGTARSAFKIMRDMSRAEGVDTSLITVPTLVVSGTAEARMPPRIGEAIAGRIANSRTVVLPECPHGLAMHQPEAIAELLADPGSS